MTKRIDVLESGVQEISALDPYAKYDVSEYKTTLSMVPAARYINHVNQSLQMAFQNRSNCHPNLLNLVKNPGFSGISFRHLLNNLGQMKGINYLEVGTFKGSTFTSMLYNNIDNFNSIYAIDNWSEFNEHGGVKDLFHNNINTNFKSDVSKMKILDVDCFNFDKSEIKDKINLYFFDGPHKREDHERAFTYYNDLLDETFITIVDDWEKGSVRQGTYDAFEKLNYNVLAKWEVLPPDRENRMRKPDQYWWHGTMLAVIQK